MWILRTPSEGASQSQHLLQVGRGKPAPACQGAIAPMDPSSGCACLSAPVHSTQHLMFALPGLGVVGLFFV